MACLPGLEEGVVREEVGRKVVGASRWRRQGQTAAGGVLGKRKKEEEETKERKRDRDDKKKQKGKMISTGTSPVVPHPSTNPA